MPKAVPTPRKPSIKQLNYLRRLASQRGQTFAYPTSSSQASAEIRRLLEQTSSTSIERHLDREAVSVMRAERSHDATRFRHDEISGYGSTAAWARGRDRNS